MDADRNAGPDDIAALKEALAVERAKALEIAAGKLAVARAKASIIVADRPADVRNCRRLAHWLSLHRELGTVVDAHFAYRVAYQDAVALGLGVVEYEPDGPAAHEVGAATDWIFKKLELA
jgi:hypothetical protein